MWGVFLLRTPPYTVGVNGNYPPYSYYDLVGNLIGFDVDLMGKIAADQGFSVTFKQIDWSETIPFLLSHEIDMYISPISSSRRSRRSWLHSLSRTGW